MQGKSYRITFLTSRLVRLEYQEAGAFEDGLTQCVRNRAFPPVEVTAVRSRGLLELDTEALHIVYDERPFSQSGLMISLKGNFSAYHSAWRYGQKLETLGGTARTLDGADGAVDVGDGLISRNGFSVLDDSASMLLSADGRFRPRENAETDLYFFGYGHDYQACLRDFHQLSGDTPLLPRFALGNWWSRYYEFSEESYLALMERFAADDVPLAVAVIDMDWHLTRVPYGSGWTGYTWNRELFPDPERFLRELHRRGMRVTLNLHPAGGVQPHEAAYPAVCAALGRDPESKLGVDFDAADERFMDAYFKRLHHPLEKQGVDFWWVDWQQGATSAVAGLDPLWVLNEGHARDARRDGKRALILSRYAGPGSHRCPVGFSGDTIISWASLAFQPYFTATAANVGYGWWSHDVGGHMRGVRDDELSVRWLQFGAFSPILRLHSSKCEFSGKEPWSYGREACAIMEDFLRLRHRLIPYLYTLSERSHRLGEVPLRPMYYEAPEREEAYRVPNQYLFGPSLLVCPLTAPCDPALRMASERAFLPEGLWVDFFDGTMYDGDRMLRLYRPLSAYPVLARGGAIVPLADDADATRNPAHMTLRVFAGADGAFELYEDDGASQEPSAARTQIALDWINGALTLRQTGDRSSLPETREWRVECVGFAETAVSRDGETVATAYDPARNALCFGFSLDAAADGASFRFARCETACDDWKRRAHDRLMALQTPLDEKEAVWRLLSEKGRTAAALGTLRALCETPGLADCLEELLLAQEERP